MTTPLILALAAPRFKRFSSFSPKKLASPTFAASLSVVVSTFTSTVVAFAPPRFPSSPLFPFYGARNANKR